MSQLSSTSSSIPRIPPHDAHSESRSASKNEDQGDIGYTVPPPRSPQQDPSGIGYRSTSRSSSIISTPSSAREQRGEDETLPLPPSRPPSTSSSASPRQSIRSIPSPSSSTDPPPRFIPWKPPLPAQAIPVETLTDPSVPFESIPLQNTPPPLTVPLPSSPRNFTPDSKKRNSWSGFGRAKDIQHVTDGSASSLYGGGARPSSAVDHTHSHDEMEGPVASGSRQNFSISPNAPAAHPHPFPLPSSSSPPVAANKRQHIASSTALSSGLGVRGASTLQKVISQTRPSWLPPKDKVEDEIHQHQWEDMMAQARSAEVERRKIGEVRKLEKERRMAISNPRWEALLNSSNFSAGKVKDDSGMRRLWFQGVPSHLRGQAWSLAIGNPLALSKGRSNPPTYEAR